MNAKARNYNGIDIFKFFFALCVVACHVPIYHTQSTSPFSAYGFFSTVINSAVPFFFISNGFFIASKLNSSTTNSDNRDIIKSNIKKYIVLYLIWTVLYMPITIYHYIVSDISPLGIAVDFFFGLVFLGEHWCSWSLWYLCSLIWSLVLIWICIHGKKANIILAAVSMILFVFAFIYGHYLSSINFLPIKLFRVIVGPTGRQFTAPLYLVLGMYLGKHEYSRLVGFILTVVGFLISPLFPSAGGGFYSEPSLLLIATGVFIVAASLKIPDSDCFVFLRTSSTVLYFTHLFIYTVICLTFLGGLTAGGELYFLVVAVCVLLSIPVFILEKKINFPVWSFRDVGQKTKQYSFIEG